MKKQRKNRGLIFLSCLTMATMVLGCVEKAESHYEGVHSFIVHAIPDGNYYGTEKSPIPTTNSLNGEGAFKFTLAAAAVDINGEVIPDYNETVTISSQPGELSKQTITFKNGMVGEWSGNGSMLKYEQGGERLSMRYAFGNTRIWVEDTQRTLRPADVYDSNNKLISKGKCQNDKVSEDGLYCEPSLASGTSEEFIFQPQTIRMIQYNPDRPDGESPLIRRYGQLKATKGHDLVVTNVVSTGFYITDLGDADFNSIFVFTFSQPGRVEIGDRVCEVQGGIAEFTGMTQLQFPSWGIQNKEQSTAQHLDPAPEDGDEGVGSCIDRETGKSRPCTVEELEAMNAIIDCSSAYFDRELTREEKKAFGRIEPPEPKAITSPTFFSMANTVAQEALEASVITVQNVRLSTEFIDCDDNGNSKIDTGTAEAECRNNCTRSSASCTELSSLNSYDQWRAWTINGNGELSVASSSLISGFDITEDQWIYQGVVPGWLGTNRHKEKNGCELNSDGVTMTCDSCYEWKDPNSKRRMIRCADRRLKRLTGNLKQVLPACSGSNAASECYASKFNSTSMVMKVIEPRFNTDIILDEEYNIKAQQAFQECRADDQPNGCLDACKITSAWCTCDAFEAYRKRSPEPGAPTACASRLTSSSTTLP